MTENDKLDTIIKLIEATKAELSLKISEIRRDLKGLVEIQQRLIHERLSVPPPPPPKEYGEEKEKFVKTGNSSKINISNFGDNRIKITGNTFDHRPLIKDIGQAKWESEIKAWSLPLSSMEALIDKFKEANLVVDRDIIVNVVVGKTPNKVYADDDGDEKVNFDNSANSFVDD